MANTPIQREPLDGDTHASSDELAGALRVIFGVFRKPLTFGSLIAGIVVGADYAITHARSPIGEAAVCLVSIVAIWVLFLSSRKK